MQPRTSHRTAHRLPLELQLHVLACAIWSEHRQRHEFETSERFGGFGLPYAYDGVVDRSLLSHPFLTQEDPELAIADVYARRIGDLLAWSEVSLSWADLIKTLENEVLVFDPSQPTHSFQSLARRRLEKVRVVEILEDISPFSSAAHRRQANLVEVIAPRLHDLTALSVHRDYFNFIPSIIAALPAKARQIRELRTCTFDSDWELVVLSCEQLRVLDVHFGDILESLTLGNGLSFLYQLRHLTQLQELRVRASCLTRHTEAATPPKLDELISGLRLRTIVIGPLHFFLDLDTACHLIETLSATIVHADIHYGTSSLFAPSCTPSEPMVLPKLKSLPLHTFDTDCTLRWSDMARLAKIINAAPIEHFAFEPAQLPPADLSSLTSLIVGKAKTMQTFFFCSKEQGTGVHPLDQDVVTAVEEMERAVQEAGIVCKAETDYFYA